MVNSQFEEMIACDEYVDTYQKEVISYKNFNELKILPVLTREEEIELMLQIKNGNEEESVQARNKFIEHNLRLVILIAKRNLEPNIDIFDLFQEGIIGLIKAIDNFDITKGYKFSTYAVPWINQCIQRYKIDKSTTIRIPVHTFEKAEKYKKTYKILCDELLREPTLEEMRLATDFSSSTIENIRRAMNAKKNS